MHLNHVDGETPPQLGLSYCALVDILGFSKRITESNEAGIESEQAEFARYYKAFQDCRKIVTPSPATCFYRSWIVKSFSDNILLAYPHTSDHAEPELGHLLQMTLYYQAEMSLRGYFVRGAVTVGNLFVDDGMAYGKALVDAAELDRKDWPPRVVLSEDLVRNWLRMHVEYYHPHSNAPQLWLVLKDCRDKVVFLDYLGPGRWEYPEDAIEDLRMHREWVVKGRALLDGKVTQKFDWVAEYHNFCCCRVFGRDELCNELAIEDAGDTRRFVPFDPNDI